MVRPGWRLLCQAGDATGRLLCRAGAAGWRSAKPPYDRITRRGWKQAPDAKICVSAIVWLEFRVEFTRRASLEAMPARIGRPQRKYLEQLRRILLSRKRESKKTRARDLFPVPTVYAHGPQRRGPHEELHHKVKGCGAWRSASAQHPQLLQVAPVFQRTQVLSVEAVDLVVEGRERLLLDGLHAARRSAPSRSRCP